MTKGAEPRPGDWMALAQGRVVLRGISYELHALHRIGDIERGIWGHTTGAVAAREAVVRWALKDGVRAWYDAGDGTKVQIGG